MSKQRNKKRLKRQKLEQVIDSWQEDYPRFFTKWPEPKLALDGSVIAQLVDEWYPKHKDEFPCEEPQEMVKQAVGMWCHGIRYQLAMGTGICYSLNLVPHELRERTVNRALEHIRTIASETKDQACLCAAIYATGREQCKEAQQIYKKVSLERMDNQFHCHRRFSDE